MLQAMPVLTFANQSGLDMLETTLAALREITMDKVLDCDQGRKSLLCADLMASVAEQGYACVEGGTCASSMGRPASYGKAVAWKVLDDGGAGAAHCVCFAFMDWSFV